MLELEKVETIPTDPEVEVILNRVQGCVVDVNLRWLNHQVYQVLSLNLEGKALNMIKNLDNRKLTNGVVGWCKLILDCSSMTSQRLQGLASKVYSPKRCKL